VVHNLVLTLHQAERSIIPSIRPLPQVLNQRHFQRDGREGRVAHLTVRVRSALSKGMCLAGSRSLACAFTCSNSLAVSSFLNSLSKSGLYFSVVPCAGSDEFLVMSVMFIATSFIH